MRVFATVVFAFFTAASTAIAQETVFDDFANIEDAVEDLRLQVAPLGQPLTSTQFSEISKSVFALPIAEADSIKVENCLLVALKLMESAETEEVSELPEPEKTQVVQILSLPDHEAMPPDLQGSLVALRFDVMLDVLGIRTPATSRVRLEYRAAKTILADSYDEGLGATGKQISETACHDPALPVLISKYRHLRIEFATLVMQRLPIAVAATAN